MKKFLLFVLVVFSWQANLNAQSFVDSRHETADQNSVTIRFDANVTFASIPGWTVTVGGVSVTISSVTAIGSNVTINFTPAIGPNQAVLVSYDGSGASTVNPFTNQVSENNYVPICSDFSWQATNTPSDPCAPVAPQERMVFRISPRARNSSVFNLGLLGARVSWGDPANTVSVLPGIESDAAGNPAANSNFYVVDGAASGFSYPANDAACGYTSVWRVRYTPLGVQCDALNANQTITFASWNTDAFGEGDGSINLPPTVANTNLVCLGENVDMSFSDNTDLNCNPTVPPIPTNDRTRWVRVRYGFPVLPAAQTIPNIVVGGVPITDANGNMLPGFETGYIPLTPNTLGNPDGIGVVTFDAPVNNPAGQLEPIITTSPDNQVVGQRFNVTIEYWNTCNAYNFPVVDNARQVTNFIEIIDSPPAPVAADREFCQSNAGNMNMTAAASMGGALTWYSNAALTNVVGTGPTLQVRRDPNTVFLGTNPPGGTSRTYYVTETLGNGCEGPPTMVVARVRNPLNQPPPMVPPQAELCPNSTYTFNIQGNLAAANETFAGITRATEYVWTIPPGWTLDAQGPSSITITTGGAAANQTISVYRRYVEPSNSIAPPDARCFSPERTLLISVRPNPTASITPLGPICQGSEPELTTGFTTPGGTNIVGHLWTGTGVASVLSATDIPNPTIRPDAPAGTYDLTYTVINNINCSGSATVQIVIDENPDAADAGPDQFVCNSTSLSLAANTPSAGSGQWTIVSKQPASRPDPALSSFTDPGATISINPGDEGRYIMRWTIENGQCISSDDVIIDFGGTPTPSNAGPNREVCGPVTTLEGNTPVVGNGTWTLVAGPSGTAQATFEDDNDPLTGVTVNEFGLYTFRWRIESGTCPPSDSQVQISFQLPATASAGDDYAICAPSQSLIVLPGTIGGSATSGSWSLVANGVPGNLGVSTQVGTTITANYTVDLTDIGTTLTFRLTTNNPPGVCTPVFDEISILIQADPVVVPQTITVCSDELPATGTGTTASVNLTTLEAAIGGGPDVTYSWFTGYDAVSRDFSGPIAPGNAPGENENFQVSDGQTVFARVENTLTGCFIAAEVEYTVIPRPGITLQYDYDEAGDPYDFSGLAIEVCQGDPLYLNGLPTGGTGSFNDFQWTEVSASGAYTLSSFDTPASVFQSGLPGVYEFDYTVGDNSSPVCSSTVRVTITVNPLPEIDFAFGFTPAYEGGNGTNTFVCSGETLYLQALPTAGSGTYVAQVWTLMSAPVGGELAVVAPGNTAAGTFTSTVPGTYVYEYTVTDNLGCAETATFTIEVEALPVANPISGADRYCVDAGAIILFQVAPNTNVNSTYEWSISQTPGTTVEVFGGSVNDFFVLLRFPEATTVTLEVVEVSPSGCRGPVNTRVVVVEDSPAPSTITGPILVCENDLGVVYSVENRVGSTFFWTVPLGASIAAGQGTNSIVVNFGIGSSGTIRVVETNETGCQSDPAELAVVAAVRPIMDFVPITPVCSDEATGITFAPAGGSVPIASYNIIEINVPGGLVPRGGNVTVGSGYADDAIFSDAFVNQTGGNLEVRYTVAPVSVQGCVGEPRIVTVRVQPQPVVSTNLNNTICSHEEINLVLAVATGSTPALNFDVVEVLVPAELTPGANAVFPATGVNAAYFANDTYTNVTAAEHVVTYRVRARSANGCLGDPRDILITIRPEPVLMPGLGASVCSGVPTGIVLTTDGTSVAANRYNVLEMNRSGSLQGVATVGNNLGPNALQNDIFTNLTANPLNITYQVTPVSAANCPGEPVEIVVTILPSPVAVNQNLSACSDAVGGSTATVDLTLSNANINNNTGFPVTWYMAPILGPANEIADPANFVVNSNVPVYAAVDNGTCISFATVVYRVDPQPSVTAIANVLYNGEQLSCEGSSNGRITITAVSGTEPYQYSLDNSNFFASNVFNGLTAGDYTVFVRDNRGCTTQTNVSITPPRALELSLTGADLACNFLNTLQHTGEILLSASGGVLAGGDAYQYSLNGGPFAPRPSGRFENLPAGNYTVQVRDSNGCLTSESITITQPAQLTINVQSQVNVDCFGESTGQLVLEGSGGTGAHEFSLNGLDFQDSPIFSNLPAGPYTLAIRDENGCSATTTTTIFQNTNLVPSFERTQVLCRGFATGEVRLSAMGGTPGYEFRIASGIYQASGTFSGLAAGTYTFFVRDALGCERTLEVEINEPDADLVATLDEVVNVNCHGDFNGSITLSAEGGVAPYRFRISSDPPGATRPTGIFQNLPAGIYTLSVRDANGCEQTLPDVEITQPDVLDLQVSEVNPTVCFNQASGQVELTAAGGTLPYTYRLLELPGNVPVVSNGGLNGRFSGVPAGQFTFSVTDANNCSRITDALVTQPDQVALEAEVLAEYNGFPLSCRDAEDGVIEVTDVRGGNGNYEFRLTNFGGQVVRGFQGNPRFENLRAGNFFVQVRDGAGCPGIPVPLFINNPFPLLGGVIGANQNICDGDQPELLNEVVMPVNSIGNYQFQWQMSVDNGATYSDFAGGIFPELSPGALAPGVYRFRRRVESGCDQAFSNVVTLTVNNLPTATFAGVVDGVPSTDFNVCEGEFFLLRFGFTGRQPYQFTYTDGQEEFVRFGPQTTQVPIPSITQSVQYTLTRVVDLNGCEITPNQVVNVNVINIDSNFTMDDPTGCSPHEVTFTHQQQAGVNYRWRWFDNQPDATYGSTESGPRSVSHLFVNPGTSQITYTVRLEASFETGVGTKTCDATTGQFVVVNPTPYVNVFPNKTEICSGEDVLFVNQTVGANGLNAHRWFYRLQGTTDQLEPRTTQGVTYNFVNNTDLNPAVYEVVYRANNTFGCAAEEAVMPITVYKNFQAGFNVNTTTPTFAGGVAPITLINTSTPLDNVNFRYDWDFGDGNTRLDDPTPSFVHNYTGFGSFQIRLTVTNRASGVCATTVTRTVQVVAVAPFAAFTIDPDKGCVPLVVNTNNQSTGADRFTWEVRDETNQRVDGSNEVNPVFEFFNPGVYRITLVATVSQTGQSSGPIERFVEVYETPVAIFDAVPQIVYIPDQEVFVINRSLKANRYEWDFGDGEGIYSGMNPTHRYTEEGFYTITLTAYNDEGGFSCPNVATRQVEARFAGFVRIPNAFTPNTDGPNDGHVSNNDPSSGNYNDVFLPVMEGVVEFHMIIADRWGNMVFESTNKDIGWNGYKNNNGALMPQGVYVYKLTVRLANGERATRIGDVTLIK